jgi:hypothetical protein
VPNKGKKSVVVDCTAEVTIDSIQYVYKMNE